MSPNRVKFPYFLRRQIRTGVEKGREEREREKHMYDAWIIILTGFVGVMVGGVFCTM